MPATGTVTVIALVTVDSTIQMGLFYFCFGVAKASTAL